MNVKEIPRVCCLFLCGGGIDELDTRRLWKEFFQYAITMLFISHDIISYNIISFFVEEAVDKKLTIQGTSGCAVYSEVVILVNLPGGKEGMYILGSPIVSLKIWREEPPGQPCNLSGDCNGCECPEGVKAFSFKTCFCDTSTNRSILVNCQKRTSRGFIFFWRGVNRDPWRCKEGYSYDRGM